MLFDSCYGYIMLCCVVYCLFAYGLLFMFTMLCMFVIACFAYLVIVDCYLIRFVVLFANSVVTFFDCSVVLVFVSLRVLCVSDGCFVGLVGLVFGCGVWDGVRRGFGCCRFRLILLVWVGFPMFCVDCNFDFIFVD